MASATCGMVSESPASSDRLADELLRASKGQCREERRYPPTAIIWSEVVGFRAFASTPSRGPIMGDVRFSMKKTGRRTVAGRPNDRIYSSICHLLSKCDSPLFRSAPPTEV